MKPFDLHFDSAASIIFQQFLMELNEMQIANAGLNNHIRKYEALFVRLSGVHHMMLYCPEADELASSGLEGIPHDITEVTAKAVYNLIMEFLLPHAKKVYGYFSEHTGRPKAERIAKWIISHKRTEFSASDIYKVAGARKADELADPLEYLELEGWIRKQAIGQHPGKGGRPGIKYLVNPKVLEMFPSVSR